MSCMILGCLECYYVIHVILPFFIFMHLHLASHLGTLDEPHEGHNVEAEPEDGVWWTYCNRTNQFKRAQVQQQSPK